MSVLTIAMKRDRFRAVSILFLAVALLAPARMRAEDNAKDILYIGDGGDNTVKRFDAANGTFLDTKSGAFVLPGSGGLDGPRGIIFAARGGNLIVANQNVDQTFSGDILKYSPKDGRFLGAIVPADAYCDVPQAPCAPRGIVSGSGHRLFVADFGGGPRGRVAQFDDETGAFLGNLDFGKFEGDAFKEYHPRGLVFGPDGRLYVSVVGNLNGPGERPADPNFDPLAGFILRFENDKLLDVFADNSTCPALHRPEGLTFGPDGKLYVTSFRADSTDTDKILVFAPDKHGACRQRDQINLDVAGGPRSFAQALLFGPGDHLFVPITNTGEVRRYDVHTKEYVQFVLPGGQLHSPWYLTFGNTDPRTLEYRP